MGLSQQTEYHITAVYNEKNHTIEGTETVTFRNVGEHALSEIYLFLYPNFYKEKNTKNNPSQAYPVAFNPGAIEIVSVRNGEGHKLTAADFFGVTTLTEIRLSAPIPPGATYRLVIQFVTQIPERYGVFGYFRDWVTLQGGWHPYLPPLINGKWDLHGLPPPSQFYVDLTVPDDMRVMSSAPLMTNTTPMPFFSLSIGRDMILQEKKVDGVDLIYTYSKRNKRYGEQVFKSAEVALLFFLSDAATLPSMTVHLTHASLHKDIVMTGSQLLYVDPRLFKVFPLLKKYHEMRIAKGVFSLLWQENLPWEEPWVIELMASITAEKFAKEHYPDAAGLKTSLKPIAFLPLIDQVLYADDPLLRKVYFKHGASENETISSFHRPTLPHYRRLKKILSDERLESIVTDYKQRVQQGEMPLLKTLLRNQEDLPAISQFFEKEFLSLGTVDFGIDRILRRRTGETYETTIDIKKEGVGVEPLEILLHKEDGTKMPLEWNGEEISYKTIVTTNSPITVVDLDPEERTSDIYRGNNRDPEKWKFLLRRFNIGYDLTTDFINYDVNFQFQPVYSTKNIINISFARNEPKDVGVIQYSHLLLNQHRVTAGISYQLPHPIPGFVLEEDAKTFSLSYALTAPDILFIEKQMAWLAGRYPQWGITFGFDKSLTGDRNDYSISGVFDFRRSFVFSNYHQMRVRLLTGVSTGDLLKNNRFFLGGENGLRGYTQLLFGGENINLISLGYHFPIAYETDINLLGLALTHTLQGVIFLDSGTVANRDELFNVSAYKSDVGAGMRWFVDFLGVLPMTFGLDVAWPMNAPSPEENKPHYYISGGRLF